MYPRLILSVGFRALFSSAALAQVPQPVRVKNYKYTRMVPANHPYAWKVKRAVWTAQDEADFGAFVARIGWAVETHKCNNFISCMSNPIANTLLPDPAGIKYYADCADVPYWLRTYFAWKRGLPMSLAVATVPRDPNDPKKDNANSDISGNEVYMRADSVAVNNTFPDVTQFLGNRQKGGLIMNNISSGTYRMPVIPDPSEPTPDFYPIAINRTSIRAGTVIYTADGHVAIVYKVDDDGNLRTLNGSPADQFAANSPLTIRFYNNTFKRSRQEHGSILKNFRPVQLEGAVSDPEGNLVGGQVVVSSNQEINANPSVPPVNTEQATLRFPSTNDYFLFVRKRMAVGPLKIDLLQEFKRQLADTCEMVQSRVALVDQAVAAGIDAKQPAVLPDSIFTDAGEWGNYSTPSKDINIKTLFKDDLDNLKSSVHSYRDNLGIYTYSGPNLAQDLADIYRSVARACTVSYTSRSGARVTLNLEQVRQRLFQISFDPYQCADLRWGDPANGAQACGEDMRWYNAEQYLRNLTEKTSPNTALTVDQMEIQNQALNKPFEFNTDIMAYIEAVARVRGVTLH